MLRVGHRPGRDPRLSTHLALVARAFGAERMYLEPGDETLIRTVRRVSEEWGGTFLVEGVSNWRQLVRDHKGHVVHLTMYGTPMPSKMNRLRRESELLVVVGGPKVPAELYRLATWNVAIGPQPHSEVGALAVFLDRLNGTHWTPTFSGGRRVVAPRAHGKRVRHRISRGR